MGCSSAVCRQQWGLGAVLCLVYVAVALFLTNPIGMTVTNGDEPHYLLMAHSLWYDHDLVLDNNYAQQDYRRFYEGEPLEPHLFPLNGRMVSAHYLAGMPFLLALPYALGGRLGVLILLSIGVASGMALLYPVLQRYVGAPLAGLSLLFCGLTYPVLIYSHQIYPDTVAFVLVAVVLNQVLADPITTYPAQPRRQALVVGVALGLLPHFHLRFGLLALTLYLGFLGQQRQRWVAALLWSLGPILLLAAALLLWLYTLFGQFSLAAFLTPHRGGFSAGRLDGIIGLWFDQEYGLLPYAPIYLLAVLGVGWLWRNPARRADLLWLLLVYGSYHVLGGTYHDWPGGFSPVPRYLIAVLPVLILLAACGLAEAGERRAWVQPLGLALTTLWVTRLILLVRRHWMFGFYAGSNTILRQHYRLEWLTDLLPSFRSEPISAAYWRLALVLVVIALGWGLSGLLNRWLFGAPAVPTRQSTRA